MTDLTTPAEIDGEVDNLSAGHAWDKAGTGSWMVDGSDIAGLYTALDETVLNAFAFASSTGLDVTIDPGEAYVAGWLCRDTQTTVTLPASTTTAVYVGYDASAVLASGEAPTDSANVIVGAAGAFAAEDPRVKIWEFTTDASTVTDSVDYRTLKKPIEHSPSADGGRFDVSMAQTQYDNPTGHYEFGFGDPTGGRTYLAAYLGVENEYNVIGSRVIGVASGSKVDPSIQLAQSGDAKYDGDVTVGRLLTDRIDMTEGSGGARIIYDDAKTGRAFHIQRDLTAGETALTVSGTNVGINNTDPSSPLHVGGRAAFDDHVTISGAVNPELPDDAYAPTGGITNYPNGYTVFRDAAGNFPMGTNSIVETLDSPGGNNGFQVNWDNGNDEYAYRVAVDSSSWGPWQYPVRSDSPYEIQKNGSDGSGVINFKTN